MTKKHLQFCIYYMQTGDPQVAYKMTYPRAAVKSLAAASSRLMARPDVAEWVHGTEERVHNRMMRQFHSEHYDQFKEKLLTINEKRTVLTKIIKGETKRVRYIKGKYGMDRVEEDLPVYAVLRAVDLDTRLENFYNYLTRSDTWRKTQNIYVNTPTLQQQVNILINQSTENEEAKDVVHADIESPQNTSPLGRGVSEPGAEEGWVLSRRTDTEEQTLSPAACLPRPFRGPDDFGSGVLSPAGGGVTAVTGVEPSRCTLAQVTPESEKNSPPACLPRPFRGPAQCGVLRRGDGHNASGVVPVGVVNSRRTPHTKKTPRYLTTVNKSVTNPCQSTTCNPPIFPPVKPHLPPPDL